MGYGKQMDRLKFRKCPINLNKKAIFEKKPLFVSRGLKVLPGYRAISFPLPGDGELRPLDSYT